MKPTASKECGWALYKGLYHLECNSFLTTTDCGGLTYASDEMPYDGICHNCGKPIEVIERKFGRQGGRNEMHNR
jgi:hypothetical protein